MPKIVSTNLALTPRNNLMNFNFSTLAQYNLGNPKAVVTPIDSVKFDTTYTYPMKFAVALKIEDNRYRFREEDGWKQLFGIPRI